MQKYGIRLEELRRLETIYLVCLDKNEVISRINDEQQKQHKVVTAIYGIGKRDSIPVDNQPDAERG